MSILEDVGKVMESRKAKAAVGVLAAGLAASGFHKGLKSQNTSAHMYNMLFNDPNYDQEVLGTHVGVRELLAPINFPIAKSFTRLGAIRSGGISGVATAANEGFINGDFLTDYSRYSNYYNNPMPNVNGSLVFGLHNASQGG